MAGLPFPMMKITVAEARLGGRPMALAYLYPLPAGLGEAHRMQAAGDDEPSPFNRLSNAGCIGFDRTQVAEGLPSLGLAAGHLKEFAHDANRRLLDRAKFWRAFSASSALRYCALWHSCYRGRDVARSPVASSPQSAVIRLTRWLLANREGNVAFCVFLR